MHEQAVFEALKYRIVVNDSGSRFYLNSAGKLHRTDGAAVEHADGGSKEWWLNDQLHRTDGPAIELADGSKRWYINNEELSEDEFNQLVKVL